jgi:TIR domain
MSSLAELPALVGFFSYSREDDEGSGGRLSKLRERIQEELRSQLGRTKADFRLWQDKTAIAHGELWEDTIKRGISEAVFFIPIITPTAVRSSYCKFEFQSFLAREKELERNNLIFPILYIPVPALTGDRWRQDPLLAIIGSRQYEDWQNLRHLDVSSSEVVALRVQTFCANICRALEQEWLSPEERRQAEARRAAEAERRRQQEAKIKQRADEEERRRKTKAEERRRDEDERRRQEAITRFDDTALRLAEVEKPRQDEERHRPEPEGKLARKEAQRQKTLEEEPQQSVRQWPLLLMGAAAAALPTLVFWLYISFDTTKTQYNPSDVFFIAIPALYGGAAGMLLRHFGILKAVAIPVIPAFLLFVIFSIFAPQHGDGNNVGTALILLVPPVICAWLAFWLHSRWARKRRMIESGLVPP